MHRPSPKNYDDFVGSLLSLASLPRRTTATPMYMDVDWNYKMPYIIAEDAFAWLVPTVLGHTALAWQ